MGLWGWFILKPQTERYPHLPDLEDVLMHLAEIAKIETVPHGLILDKYHERRTALSSEEASHTQATAVSKIMEEATKQALNLLEQLGKDRESFRHLGLTFEEKAFYDILIHLRDKYNFVYGEDKEENGFILNDKCKVLAKKIKELIDIQSSFTDWLNNINIRADLNNKIFICLHRNGYPPQYNDEVIDQVMEQVEYFKEYGR